MCTGFPDGRGAAICSSTQANNVSAAGEYEVEVQQGCGTGSGGAEVAGQTLMFTFLEMGNFQYMIQRVIGVVKPPGGANTEKLRGPAS